MNAYDLAAEIADHPIDPHDAQRIGTHAPVACPDPECSGIHCEDHGVDRNGCDFMCIDYDAHDAHNDQQHPR